MSRKVKSIVVEIVATAAVLVVLGVLSFDVDSDALVRLSSRPVGIMGTECKLTAVAPRDRASPALERAEGALRNVESLMSVYLEASELSKLNKAPAGRSIPLSPELMKVLSAAGKFNEQTDGAFDVTCYTLIRLWKRCGSENRLPGEAELAEARKRVGMKHLQIAPDGVTKLAGGVMIDLGGIAKGYAIDRAIEAMKKAGAVGGVVDVGGDLRCFGVSGESKPWPVKIRHPFDKTRICATLSVTAAAVTTSGDYHRYFEISGRRYSHIVDPRTGMALPAGHAPSVTVISLPVGDVPPSAAAADAWATAVSVLGAEGIELIDAQPGLEAMIITGTPDQHEIRMSEGFKSLLSPGGQINLE
ncbi:MAG: FAD:protein FMN transferase [Planctomycetota bacterium]|nr:FAD:protein FMN transferase [Planctomycetota bacterium]